MHKLCGGTPFGRPLRHRSQAMGITRSQIAKKYTANGLVRRGRPLTSQTAFGGQLPYKGSLVRPVARFHHSQSKYNGRFLRATNHEQRATIFSTAEGHSRRCRQFEPVAAYVIGNVHRIHAGRPLGVPYGGGLRPAGPSGPIFDERRTTYDERLFRPQHTICEIFFLLFMGELRTIGLYLLKYQCKGRG